MKECPPETPAHFTGLCTTCTAEYGPNTKNIFWDPVAEKCIDTCPQGTVLPLGGGKTCVDECGTNERKQDWHCVCAENAAFSAKKVKCFVPDPESEDCRRITNAAGTKTCVPENKCGGESFVALDKVSCVGACPNPYFEESKGEKMCRSGCSGLFVEGKALT